MSAQFDLLALAAKFPVEDLEWRIGEAGKRQNGEIWARVFTYITNRAIQTRLDDVVGPANWRNEFREWMGTAQLCGISILVDGQWVTKWDGAGATDVEGIKGGLSDAMKRAAVQWGIGRYLYDLDEGWAEILPAGSKHKGSHYGKTKDGTVFYWLPPELPAWALPDGKPQHSPAPQPARSNGNVPKAAQAEAKDEAKAGSARRGPPPTDAEWGAMNREARDAYARAHLTELTKDQRCEFFLIGVELGEEAGDIARLGKVKDFADKQYADGWITDEHLRNIIDNISKALTRMAQPAA